MPDDDSKLRMCKCGGVASGGVSGMEHRALHVSDGGVVHVPHGGLPGGVDHALGDALDDALGDALMTNLELLLPFSPQPKSPSDTDSPCLARMRVRLPVLVRARAFGLTCIVGVACVVANDIPAKHVEEAEAEARDEAEGTSSTARLGLSLRRLELERGVYVGGRLAVAAAVGSRACALLI